MNRFRPYLKAAVVISATALVGVLVAYRAGAFTSPTQSVAAEPAPAPLLGAEPSPPNTPDAPAPVPPKFMGGSKFAPIVTPESKVPYAP